MYLAIEFELRTTFLDISHIDEATNPFLQWNRLIVPLSKITKTNQFFDIPKSYENEIYVDRLYTMLHTTDFKLATISNKQNTIAHTGVRTSLKIDGVNQTIFSNNTSKPLKAHLFEDSITSHKYGCSTNPRDWGMWSRGGNSKNPLTPEQYEIENLAYAINKDFILWFGTSSQKTTHTTPPLIDLKAEFVCHSVEKLTPTELTTFINAFAIVWCSDKIHVIHQFNKRPIDTIVLSKTIPQTYIDQNPNDLATAEYSKIHDMVVLQTMKSCGVSIQSLPYYKLMSLLTLRGHLDPKSLSIAFINKGPLDYSRYPMLFPSDTIDTL